MEATGKFLFTEGKTRGEQIFDRVLLATGLSYTFHRTIRHHGVILITPDFYIPEYDVYIEVISNRQSLYGRLDRLARAIRLGFNITFYFHNGLKLKLTKNVLNRLGVISNDHLFTIPEIEIIKDISGKIEHIESYTTPMRKVMVQ